MCYNRSSLRVILASQSPRRKEILERMGFFGFEVIPAKADESCPSDWTPADVVENLSRRKGLEVAASHPDALVIAADTVVAIDGRILGKPHSREKAAQMLSLLSGREHQVYTGVTVCYGGETVTEHEATPVRFRPLSRADILRYIATGEPMDKAGAYGIQGRGCLLVEGITGDYYNVMGLPVCRLNRLLLRLGVDPLALAAEGERER